MFEKEEKRFELKVEQRFGMDGSVVRVIVDKVTGVNYLFGAGSFEGVTPLLDENGKVLIDK